MICWPMLPHGVSCNLNDRKLSTLQSFLSRVLTLPSPVWQHQAQPVIPSMSTTRSASKFDNQSWFRSRSSSSKRTIMGPSSGPRIPVKSIPKCSTKSSNQTTQCFLQCSPQNLQCKSSWSARRANQAVRVDVELWCSPTKMLSRDCRP